MIESLQRALALVCVCITLACTPESDTSESLASELTAEQGKPPVGAWVVIDEGRGLFKTANPEAGRIGIGTEAQLRVVEVVANDNELLEVRTIADRGGICTRVVEPRPNYQLRFFVEPEAVQQVSTRTVGAEFEDGTSLELAPGVPVIETGTPGKVRLDSATLLVDIAEADVGRWFLPSSVEPRDQPLRYGEHGELLTFVNACGRFVLRPGEPAGILGILEQHDGKFLPAHDWGDEDDDAIWGDGCSSIVRKAAAGTELSWLNGGAAGVVLVPHEIPRNAKQLDDRFCFEVSGLTVCIPVGELMTETGFDCGLIGLTTDRPAPASKPGSGVRLGKIEGGKGLDRDIVRRIVRAHLNELRSCYARGLAEDPTLAGRVVIAFEVAATGKVSSASVKSSKLVPADDQVPACMAKAFKRWTFLRPTTGKTVKVAYPIYLSP
jgi:hypothetical protein